MYELFKGSLGARGKTRAEQSRTERGKEISLDLFLAVSQPAQPGSSLTQARATSSFQGTVERDFLSSLYTFAYSSIIL
jgi:hypothetical protein